MESEKRAVLVLVAAIIGLIALFGATCQKTSQTDPSGKFCSVAFPKTGAAIINQPNSTDAYCSAAERCYGTRHIGLQGPRCEWSNVRLCGTNSTCPEGMELVKSCEKTCLRDSCQPCLAECKPVAPSPTPKNKKTLCGRCGAGAPIECAGLVYEITQTSCARVEYAKTLACARGVAPVTQLFICPSCPKGTIYGQCVPGGPFGLEKTTICFSTYQTACELAPRCGDGEVEISRSDCTTRSQDKVSCCEIYG